MYQIDRDKNEIVELPSQRFAELGFTERRHLQEWIAKCPSALGEELLIIQKEFDRFDETRERLDLLALDEEGSLVVIENKLDDSGRDVVWQSLKYASYCSSLSKSQIVEIYQDYLDRYEGGYDARERLREFFEDREFSELILNQGTDQRIIMIAANFRKEVTSTVLWLLQHGIRLQCFKATAFKQGSELLLNLEQIIPVPEAADFMIGISEKEKEQQTTERTLAVREKQRLEFWDKMLAALEKAGVALYGNVSPGKDHYLMAGSGLSGVRYGMIFSRKEARVELYISRSSKEENKQIFDQLMNRRSEIESAFGSNLEWQRLDHKKASRITFRKEFDGHETENWPKMIPWMTEYIERLEKAVAPYLAEVSKNFKTSVFSTTGAMTSGDLEDRELTELPVTELISRP